MTAEEFLTDWYNDGAKGSSTEAMEEYAKHKSIEWKAKLADELLEREDRIKELEEENKKQKDVLNLVLKDIEWNKDSPTKSLILKALR